MCYSAIVVTSACQKDPNHWFEAEICWRQCCYQSGVSHESVVKWNRLCDNLLLRAVTIPCDNLTEVAHDECYVCKKIAQTYLSQAGADDALTETQANMYDNEGNVIDEEQHRTRIEQLVEKNRDLANRMNWLQSELFSMENERGYHHNHPEVREGRDMLHTVNLEIITIRLEIDAEELALIPLDHSTRVAWITYNQKKKVLESAMISPLYSDTAGQFYYGNQGSSSQQCERAVGLNPPTAFPGEKFLARVMYDIVPSTQVVLTYETEG